MWGGAAAPRGQAHARSRLGEAGASLVGESIRLLGVVSNRRRCEELAVPELILEPVAVPELILEAGITSRALI